VSWRTTFVLAAALLVASVFTWFDLRSDVSRGAGTWFDGMRTPAPGENITRLLSFDPGKVTGIHLRRSDVDARLRRVDGQWQGVARPQAIDDFVHNLSELAEIMRLDIEPTQRREYGLDPPEGVIELDRDGEPPIILLLGNHNPPSTGAYAEVGPSGPVVLTGALALWELDKAVRAVQEAAQSPTASGSAESSAPS